MPVLDLGNLADDFNENPYPHYARLRESGPVHRVKTADGEEIWLIVGHDEARQALAHPDVSKNWQSAGLYADRTTTTLSTNMLRSDPPHHTRLRRLVAREFTSRRVEALRPRVQQVTDELLDAMAAAPDRRADLIRSFAVPLPMTVICELLGVPDLERGSFRQWSTEIVAPTGKEAETAALRAMSGYLAELTDAKRHSPGEDLLSALIRTRDEDGDRLSPEELVGMAFLLLVAGHETTVNLIGNGVRALLAHPDQLAALRADPDGLIDGAVEEMLRYDGPLESATFRFARADLEIGGTCIEAGSAVLVALAAADRDPVRFAQPDVFDIRRTGQSHMAFGHGIHFCIGAPLARMEGRIAIRTLLERFPGLAEDPAAGPREWIPGTLIRGVKQLPVRW
ncbi:cytochrome P450 [Streptomyces sp. ISL-94]|uniref:cytochrome P450 family protein n=1 Tax=Streptomyces sp. ISL-94 TaxID=2819190 RepID=UPI001BE68B0C|nr:cytochrome P450 [Streptomyces sp. ISL-94]MBT2481152.1 cytochrome P450 [Streptomyces sp. ISL-94]